MKQQIEVLKPSIILLIDNGIFPSYESLMSKYCKSTVFQTEKYLRVFHPLPVLTCGDNLGFPDRPVQS